MSFLILETIFAKKDRFLESPRTDPPVSKRQIISPIYFATDPNRSTKNSQKKAVS